MLYEVITPELFQGRIQRFAGLSGNAGATKQYDIKCTQARLPVAKAFPYEPLDAVTRYRVMHNLSGQLV